MRDFGILDKFYLAGGTALAIKLERRESVDLGFFSMNFPVMNTLMLGIRQFGPEVIYQDGATLDVIVDGVKVSFLKYEYPMLNMFEKNEGMKMASMQDIAAMKLSAIMSWGTKKDFVDIYFLLENYTMAELVEMFKKKFEGIDYSLVHLKKSLVYFEDADREPMPRMIKAVEWDMVKGRMEEVVNF